MSWEFRVTGDLTPIIVALDRLAHIDYTPLAETIKKILEEENAAAREAGLDFRGETFDSLYRTVTKGRNKGQRRSLRPAEMGRRGGEGPPLAPRGAGSRVVTGFDVQILPLADGAILVRGNWPNFPELIFHVEGRGHNPVRDPVGITPAAQERIRDAVDEFLAAYLAGAN